MNIRRLFFYILPLFILFHTGLCAAEKTPEGMFSLYEQNRQEKIPNYITEDFILLAYSMVLNQTVTDLEETVLLPKMQEFIEALIARHQKSNLTDVEKANLDFLIVLSSLLSGEDRYQAATNPDLVLTELRNIKEGRGFDDSKLMLQKIDYSQFKIRGKYTSKKELGRYFQAMRYAGTVLFPIKESAATGISAGQADRLTSQAVGLARMIHDDPKLRKLYHEIEGAMTFIFGPPDDLISEDYVEIKAEFSDSTIPELRKELLEYAKKNGRQPTIISGWVDRAKLGEDSPEDVLTGWRFIPSRYSPSNAAFQQLTFDKVGEYKGKKMPFSLTVINNQPVKGFPLGLELMHLLGSKEACKRLENHGEMTYEGYEGALTKAKSMLDRPSGLSTGHFSLMNAWLTNGNQTDEARRLNTCLSFWTCQNHITFLYAKQSYTVVEKGISFDGRKHAWIEPAPDLYGHLENLVQQLMLHYNHQRLERFLNLLYTCREISEKELHHIELDEDDVVFLNRLDIELLNLTGGKDEPIIVDVHTESNSAHVLEEAIGFPRTISLDAGNVTYRGVLFRYYEFKHPMKDRLTDETWLEMLGDGNNLKTLNFSPGSSLWSR